jgi:hypothetical protein
MRCRKTAPARSAGANAGILVVEKLFSIKIKSKNADGPFDEYSPEAGAAIASRA